MGLTVFIGKNLVSATAAYYRTHRIEHIYHTKGYEYHYNGKYRNTLGHKSLSKHVGERAEHAVLSTEEISEVLPEFPGHSAVACKDSEVGDSERNTYGGSSENADDYSTLHLQFFKNSYKEQADDCYGRSFCRGKRLGEAVYNLIAPVGKIYEADLGISVENDNTCVLTSDICDKQTYTDGNSTSDRFGHAVEGKLAEVFAVDFYNGKKKEEQSRNKHEHKGLSRAEFTVSAPAADNTAEHGVESHTRCLSKRHFSHERHKKRAYDSTESRCDKRRRPIRTV